MKNKFKNFLEKRNLWTEWKNRIESRHGTSWERVLELKFTNPCSWIVGTFTWPSHRIWSRANSEWLYYLDKIRKIKRNPRKCFAKKGDK